MKQTSRLDLSRLHMMEFFGILLRMKELVRALFPEGTDREMADQFVKAVDALDEVVVGNRKNSFTAQQRAADRAFDELHTNAYAYARLMLHHPLAEVREAARDLFALFDKYGRIAHMGFSVEYAKAHHLLNELQHLPKQKIETLHFAPWLEAMQAAADRFEEINMQKSAEDAATITGIARTQRSHAEQAFRLLNMKVNALYAIYQQPHYERYIDTVNTYIADARALIKARKTRKENAENTDS